MTTEEIARFVDGMTYEDYRVRLYGKTYQCLGLTFYPTRGKTAIQVGEVIPDDYGWSRVLLDYESDSRDECMKHFLEDKYWDGKSFYEVAPDMEWID